jgi:hypothetical protein
MTILTETFPGAPGGSNLALPQHELDDTEARLIQDGLVDRPGEVRRRGPVRGVSGIAAFTNKATGFAISLDPLGTDRYAVLNGDGSNGYFSVLSDDLTTKVDLAWPHPLPAAPPVSPYRIVDSKPSLKSGTMVGVSSAYDANDPNQGIAWWRGGWRANNSTGTITVARGSAAVTGSGTSWLSTITPGMWLFANTDEGYTNTLIGVVMEIASNDSLTLAEVSPYAITAKTVTFQALRGLYPRVTKGRITTATNSTTVNGGKTRFLAQLMNSGTWQIYRQSDFAFVGKVASVASETSLTLAANAALDLSDEEFIAIKADADWSIENTGNTSKVGFLNAVYAERQWYANLGAQFAKTSRVWFSDTNDAEALDVAEDGDWIEVTSTAMVNEPIRALMPAYNNLMVFKENETFGIFGSSPSQFAVKKIHDDGALSGMSVQPWGGGAIWAGREGIHFFDGIQVTNLTQQKLGDVWKNSVRSFDPNNYRMWSMMDRDHYILHIEDLDPTVAIVKGNVSTTPTYWVVVINMTTRSITFLTNVRLRGAVRLPASAGRQTWYIVNDSTKGVICDASDLFDAEGADSFGADGLTAGPDFFFESKKFAAGDSLRLKRFKQLAAHYLVQGGDIKIDTILGLNNVGQTLTSVFPSSGYTWSSLSASVSTWDALKDQFATWGELVQSVYIPKRVRFLKRSQHISFRLYQSTSAITRLKIGPYSIGYKLMRPGRV